MLCSVNCDDYFEWRGFSCPPVGRSSGGLEELGREGQQEQHQPTSPAARGQRHGKEAAKRRSLRLQENSIFTILNKSFEYRSHGDIEILTSEDPSLGGLLLPLNGSVAEDDGSDKVAVLSLYSDPVDTRTPADYDIVPQLSTDEFKLPPRPPVAVTRRQPLRERSNLPLPPSCHGGGGSVRSSKLRSVSMSPLRTTFKSLVGDRESKGKNYCYLSVSGFKYQGPILPSS
jgi:hypothetical protein